MPIRRLADSKRAAFPRIAKLRKGGEKGEKRPGADLSYFRFTAEPGYEEAEAVFAEVYGEQPQQLRVYLPYSEPSRNFDSWQEQWAGGKLIHRCDGEYCVKWIGDDGQYVYDPKMELKYPCPFANDRANRNGCKPVGRLELILPELWAAGYMGLVMLETHSFNDIAHIGVVLEEMYKRADHEKGLQGIAFVLQRRQERIRRATEGGMQTVTKWLVKIEPETEWMLAQLDVARREQLGVTEPDVAPVEDAGDLPVDVETGEILDDEEADPAIMEAYAKQAKWFKQRVTDELGLTLGEAKELLAKRLGRPLEYFYDSGLLPQDAMNAIVLQLGDETAEPDQEGLPI
ncbi:MAG: hypothetical protein GX657_15895 [Chloroflexi bacterium]|nr:hypothetical protein [Chloroflexota bacterium]